MILIKNLSYQINGKNILENINVEIKEKRITGILGPNGSGKTTLLKFLTKELSSKNNIFINNKNINNFTRKDFAKTISFVEQNFSGLNEITIEDIVKMGRYPYKKLFLDYSFNDKKIINEMLLKFDLLNLKGKKAKEVSGGELKRTFIAKAFVQQSEIILLDEPINHLDIKYQFHLMNLLKSMKDRTILLSIHNIDFALKFCDDIILMNNGKIISYGETQKILTSLKIKEIFEIDIKIIKVCGENCIFYKTKSPIKNF